MTTLNLNQKLSGTPLPVYMSYVEGTTAPTEYGVWQNTGAWFEFTTPLGQSSIMGFVSIKASIINSYIENIAGNCQGTLIVRTTFDPLNTNSRVYGNDYYATMARFGRTTKNNLPFDYNYTLAEGVTFNHEYSSGFGVNGLVPGETYKVYVQVMKDRTDTKLTFDVAVDIFFQFTLIF